MSSSPALTVSVASIRAQCRASNGCKYSASEDLTPLITSVALSTSSPPQATIVGEGLSVMEEAAAGEGVVPAVSIGRVTCDVLQRSDVGITCELPHALRPGSNVVKVCAIATLIEDVAAPKHSCYPVHRTMDPVFSNTNHIQTASRQHGPATHTIRMTES